MASFRSKNKRALKVKEFPDMRLFMSAGLRYSLGRKTYAPSFFMGYLRENIDLFHVYSLEIFERDLQDFVDQYWEDDDWTIRENVFQAKELIESIKERL